MEHRWSARKRVAGAVYIEGEDIGPIRASLRDIGLGGMCVDTEFALPLCRVVRTTFTLPHGARGDEFHVEALVVRSEGKRAGLMFVDTSADRTERLRQALYEARWPRRATGGGSVGRTGSPARPPAIRKPGRTAEPR